MKINKSLLRGNVSDTLKIIVFAFSMALFSFWLQGNIEIDWGDEGYLWYGVWRTTQGEVPMRDFYSYDPGRYYWSAGWALLFGDSIMALRTSFAIFQVIGLTFGLLALRRVIRSWGFMFLAGFLLLIWMHPRFKYFEYSMAIAMVYFAIFIIEKPSLRRHFAAGVFVGIAAFFGRNFGVYGFTSFFLLLLFIWWKIERGHLFKRIGIWTAGVVIGYAPMLFMLVWIPGFFQGFIEMVAITLPKGVSSATIPKPVPWPWTVELSSINSNTLSQISTGFFFLILPLFYISLGIGFLLIKRENLKKNPLIVASVFVGVMFLHYAFDSPDRQHLAGAIQPFLIGLLSLPWAFRNFYRKVFSIAGLIVVCVMSYFSVVTASPYYKKTVAPEGTFVKIDIRGNTLWVHKSRAAIINTLIQLNAKHIDSDEGLFVAMYRPMFYVILQRKSPIYQIDLSAVTSPHIERRMISNLENNNVHWVIWNDYSHLVDYRRLQYTHYFTWRYIVENFEPFPGNGGFPEKYRVWRKRQATQNSWETPLIRFELTKLSMHILRREGLPENVVKALKPLKHRNFTNEQTFLAMVETYIGKEQTQKYQVSIVKSAIYAHLSAN